MVKMKNIKCILGLHNYILLGSQTAKNVIGGFSMSPIHRDIKKCIRCNKIKRIPYDIATDVHLDDGFDWQPKFKIY